MASLFLIRHGEPAISGVLLGQMDPALSARGRQQVASSLAQVRVEVAWTSPLRRARQSAAFVRAHRLVELPELKEIDQGAWTGKTWTEVEANWGELAAAKQGDWFGVPPPGGETWHGFLERVRNAWNLIRGGPAPAAVIAHQGVNAALLHLIDGRSPLAFTQAYGEVIRIEYD